MRLILENVELHVNPDGKTVTIDTSKAETRLETEPGETDGCKLEPRQEDYSDIRPGDLVEFDYDRHYGPTLCYCDLDDDWYIKNETNNPVWFLHADGTPFKDCSNIVIHREKRMKETVTKGTCVIIPAETVDETTYSDIRPGDIVEFDYDGEHYGPSACGQDWSEDWAIGLDEYFMHCDGTPFDGISNIIIHRELRTKKPEDSGLYITQSGRMVIKDEWSDTFDLFWPDGNHVLCPNWEYLISILKESELPLRKAKAVAE